MLRSILIRIGLIAILASTQVSSLHASEVVLTHQGRLLDASDQPVTGSVSITFSIYEAPTGGAPMWSELHPAVPVEDGLFIEQLGELVPLPVDVLSPSNEATPTRWLEIQVSGEVLLPRVRLGATPAAASSSRVSGDISTSPGAVIMSRMSGSTTGTIRMAAAPDSTGITLESDSDGDGIPESSHSSFGSTPRSGSLSVSIQGDARAGLRTIVTPDSVVEELSIEEASLPVAGSSMTVNDRSVARQWAGHSGSTTGTIRMATAPDSTESVLDSDIDGDGFSESSVGSKTKGTKATSHLAGMSGSTTGTIRMAASPDSSESVMETDSDGDGVPESSVSSKTKPFKSGSILSGMSGSTTGTIRMAASPDSTNTALDSDTNGDGIPESSVKSKTSGPRATTSLSGMSGSTTGTIRMSAFPESTMTVLGTDTNGDLVPENLIVHKSKGTQAGSTLSGMSGSTTGTIRMQASGSGQGGGSSLVAAELDVDGDSDPEGGSSLNAKENRATLETFFETGDIPTQDNFVRTTCDAGGSELVIRRPTTALLTWGTGLAFRTDATGPSLTMDVDSVPTFTVHNGDGYLSTKLGIGKTPVEKIDVDGGAYCDGANWVNASDRNSKENFRSVDGEKLLRELSDLEITQWNYKGDDGTTHIGPTAQDFKKSFGLGKDDKSISTIDPSGVALAAIKALYELTQKQAAEIEDLKSEMARIRKTTR